MAFEEVQGILEEESQNKNLKPKMYFGRSRNIFVSELERLRTALKGGSRGPTRRKGQESQRTTLLSYF